MHECQWTYIYLDWHTLSHPSYTWFVCILINILYVSWLIISWLKCCMLINRYLDRDIVCWLAIVPNCSKAFFMSDPISLIQFYWYQGEYFSKILWHVSQYEAFRINARKRTKRFTWNKISFACIFCWKSLIMSNEPPHEIMVLITQATSKSSGEPKHPCSLARAVAVYTHKVWK